MMRALLQLVGRRLSAVVARELPGFLARSGAAPAPGGAPAGRSAGSGSSPAGSDSTVAVLLGCLWAQQAWGAYWQWDPKETWALIVWLNYAAWLHMRLMKGLRGAVSAWWALVGLAVTTFAFLGVNMFLSGLHSYGTL